MPFVSVNSYYPKSQREDDSRAPKKPPANFVSVNGPRRIVTPPIERRLATKNERLKEQQEQLRARAVKIHAMVTRLGTIGAVAQELGMRPARVGQILQHAATEGWIKPNHTPPSPTVLIDLLKELGTFAAVARVTEYSTTLIARVIKKHLSEREIEAIRDAAHYASIWKPYMDLCRSLGYIPNAGTLQLRTAGAEQTIYGRVKDLFPQESWSEIQRRAHLECQFPIETREFREMRVLHGSLRDPALFLRVVDVVVSMKRIPTEDEIAQAGLRDLIDACMLAEHWSWFDLTRRLSRTTGVPRNAGDGARIVKRKRKKPVDRQVRKQARIAVLSDRLHTVATNCGFVPKPSTLNKLGKMSLCAELYKLLRPEGFHELRSSIAATSGLRIE